MFFMAADLMVESRKQSASTDSFDMMCRANAFCQKRAISRDFDSSSKDLIAAINTSAEHDVSAAIAAAEYAGSRLAGLRGAGSQSVTLGIGVKRRGPKKQEADNKRKTQSVETVSHARKTWRGASNGGRRFNRGNKRFFYGKKKIKDENPLVSLNDDPQTSNVADDEFDESFFVQKETHPPVFSQSQYDDAQRKIATLCSQLTDEFLLSTLLDVFGLHSFRTGQKETIQRVIRGDSTLLILPTGGGKSLCYQLPAFLLPGTTVVVSPLLSLIRDQQTRCPVQLNAQSLHSGLSRDAESHVLQDVRAGKCKLLFIAPERLTNRRFLAAMSEMPFIPLLCIDEAHCVSMWSHNFRPAYSRILPNIAKRLRVRCVLGCTATATRCTRNSVLKAFNMASDCLVEYSCVRENLYLTVFCPDYDPLTSEEGKARGKWSRSLSSAVLSENARKKVSWQDPRKLEALVRLLTSQRLQTRPVIVYTATKYVAELVSKHLVDHRIRSGVYHAEMPLPVRNEVQKRFFADDLRVVVATTAFGMGIDKENIAGVVHYDLPKSLESFAQEVGRAGRDGSQSLCCAFVHPRDLLRARTLAHSDACTIDSILGVLRTIFDGQYVGAEVAIKDSDSDTLFDLKPEVLETIVTRLQLDFGHVDVLPPMYCTCTVGFLREPKPAERSPLIQFVRTCPLGKFGNHQFNLIEASKSLQMSSLELKEQLSMLSSQKTVVTSFSERAVAVRVSSFPTDLASLAHSLSATLSAEETVREWQADMCFRALSKCAKNSIDEITNAGDESLEGWSSVLRSDLAYYFSQARSPAEMLDNTSDATNNDVSLEEDDLKEWKELFLPGEMSDECTHVRSATLDFTRRFDLPTMKGVLRATEEEQGLVIPGGKARVKALAITRVFHALASPRMDRRDWCFNPYWGRFRHIEFNWLRATVLNVLQENALQPHS
eukprot:Rmarinus@m.4680